MVCASRWLTLRARALCLCAVKMADLATGTQRAVALRAEFDALLADLARDDTPAFDAQGLLDALAAHRERYRRVREQRNLRPLQQREKALPSAGDKLKRSEDHFTSQRKRGLQSGSTLVEWKRRWSCFCPSSTSRPGSGGKISAKPCKKGSKQQGKGSSSWDVQE